MKPCLHGMYNAWPVNSHFTLFMENETAKPATSRVRQVNVSAEEAGQRIDNFLSRHLKGVPRSHIYRILRRGEVRVNRGRIRPHYKVQAGDTVRIPPLRL